VPNHLAGESSPYLLQHADNPVDWYPWGEEALERARREDKPVFLSIGYSACHWCHVMERESFTDLPTAQYLNEHFVSIKVDREERPDLDAIYMQAVNAMTGRGGWPLSVWLTPDGAPFYGGTYYPPRPRYGMPSFRQVLEAVASAWSGRRQDLRDTALRLVDHLGRDAEGPAARKLEPPLRSALIDEAVETLQRSFDPIYGGWGEAPKFPQPMVLDFLLARQAVSPRPDVGSALELTLDAMASGGIYDHLGGGFHRYSTDERWLVPHFEKMLYDNAQLARSYLHAWLRLKKSRYREVAEETLDYLLRRMRHPKGGFFSAEDADSEGKEGAFYVWTLEQVKELLTPEEAELFTATYGVTAQGDFEGANILHLAAGPSAQRESGGPLRRAPLSEPLLASARHRLFQAREQRPRPARDEKVLAGWNGLALTALAEAARALGSDRYREAALAAGEFILDELVGPGDRLAHVWKDGAARGNGFLDDYASVIEGFLALYQATFAERWFVAAQALTDVMVQRFHRSAGGFYDTSDDHEALLVRPRSLHDSPTPSGNSLAATVLLKMAAYTGDGRYTRYAEETLGSATRLVTRAPMMFGQWLSALHLAESGVAELAVVGDLSSPVARDLLSVAGSSYRPDLVVAARPSGTRSALALLEGREPDAGAVATAWLCRGSTCLPPTSDPDELSVLLDS